MAGQDLTAQFAEQIADAGKSRSQLRICGGGSKAFLGCRFDGETLDVSAHSGVVDYEPNELVITVRAGTTLEEIEAALAEYSQIPGFEPPRHSSSSTIGGTFACNLSGPARPWRGSIRDAVLGIRLINGKGEQLRFGGRVIKNVAGFDAARLQAGAYGALGVLTELSFKVLPQPESTVTLAQDLDAGFSVLRMNELAASSAPIDGAAWIGGRQFIRLSGNPAAVAAAARKIGGDRTDAVIWQQLRDHDAAIFGTSDDRPLWRFSVNSKTDAICGDDVVIDWGGAQRFMRADQTLDQLSAVAASAGGHVTRMSHNSDGTEFMQQPAESVRQLHQSLKLAFDPDRILNPGRLYGWL